MTREGLLRSNAVIDGVRHDNELWSILANEWVARPENMGQEFAW
jgi:RimJ/RimL family protein N-acetyltransferase